MEGCVQVVVHYCVNIAFVDSIELQTVTTLSIERLLVPHVVYVRGKGKLPEMNVQTD